MGNVGIALLVALGASAWIYAQAAKRSAGSMSTVYIATGFGAVFVFFVVWLTLSTFFSK